MLVGSTLNIHTNDWREGKEGGVMLVERGDEIMGEKKVKLQLNAGIFHKKEVFCM